jgi:hypothetical protein
MCFNKFLIWQQGMIFINKVFDIMPFYQENKKLRLKQSKSCSLSSLIMLVVDMKTACSLQREA